MRALTVLVPTFVASGVLALAIEGTARANSAAPYSRPTGAMPGMVVERPSPVLVERENLAIECADHENPIHPTCTFTATYFLRNPAPNDEELLGAFYTADKPAAYSGRGPQSEPISAALDGKDARANATEEQVARMDAIVREDKLLAQMLDERAFTLHHHAFQITLPAGAQKQLVFTGTLEALEYEDISEHGGYTLPPVLARHVYFGPNEREDFEGSVEEFLYLVSPLARWAGSPEVHVTIRHVSGSHFSSSTGHFATTSADGKKTESIVLHAPYSENLRFKLVRPEPFIHNGGPVIGIGPRIGREELHVRLGYEVGLSSSFILGAAVDTNFDKYATTALTVDAATPDALIIIPSLSAGVGVPVQFRHGTDPRVGIRAQFGLSFPILSILFPIDIYPRANSSGSHAEVSFLTQISF